MRAGKFPFAVFFFLPPSRSDVVVGTFDPETNAPNGNKQQDGTKVDSTDGVLARKPRPPPAQPLREQSDLDESRFSRGDVAQPTSQRNFRLFFFHLINSDNKQLRSAAVS